MINVAEFNIDWLAHVYHWELTDTECAYRLVGAGFGDDAGYMASIYHIEDDRWELH
jgi:hypothetical protein